MLAVAGADRIPSLTDSTVLGCCGNLDHLMPGTRQLTGDLFPQSKVIEEYHVTARRQGILTRKGLSLPCSLMKERLRLYFLIGSRSSRFAGEESSPWFNPVSLALEGIRR